MKAETKSLKKNLLYEDLFASENNLISLNTLHQSLVNDSIKYKNSDPFPHIVLDNFLSSDGAAEAMEGFCGVNWSAYKHFNENKNGSNKKNSFGPKLSNVIDALNSAEFLSYLSELTGINNLIADTHLGSGGVHRSTRGGFLNIHADFTVHPYRSNWHRRLNVLVYLNEEWDSTWGGELELWDTDMSCCVEKIAPVFNRCVVFNTNYDSYHGHPEAMTCPEGTWRKSIALYYYTLADEDVKTVATNYRPRPQDIRMSRLLMYLDKKAVSVFHFLKGKFGISDDVVTKVTSIFQKNK